MFCYLSNYNKTDHFVFGKNFDLIDPVLDPDIVTDDHAHDYRLFCSSQSPCPRSTFTQSLA